MQYCLWGFFVLLVSRQSIFEGEEPKQKKQQEDGTRCNEQKGYGQDETAGGLGGRRHKGSVGHDEPGGQGQHGEEM